MTRADADYRCCRVETSVWRRDRPTPTSASDALRVSSCSAVFLLRCVLPIGVMGQINLLGWNLLTSYGTVEEAVEAMKLGAYDFIIKTVDLQLVEPVVNRALEYLALRRQAAKDKARP